MGMCTSPSKGERPGLSPGILFPTFSSVLQVWEGHNVVHASRAMIGHTDSTEAAPGTIRGDFSIHISRYRGPETLDFPLWGKKGQHLGRKSAPKAYPGDLGILLG
jgi:hypothetical protein